MKQIADDQGRLDLSKLKKQKRLADMLDRGWEWKVLKWQVGDTWERAPDILQAALNASHGVGADASEMEVAMSIADRVQAAEERGDESADVWGDAVNEACASKPACTSYADKIGTLVHMYGGGQEAPVIRKLDSIAKQWNDTRKLGSEFLGAVVDAKLHPTKAMARVRGCLLVTNMTAERCVDGIARLLTKSDVAALQSRTKRPEVERVELELERASDLVVHIERQQKVADTDLLEVEGRFMIRCGAHLCGKGKQTFERQAHDQVVDIIVLFMRELHDAVGKSGKEGEITLNIPASWEATLLSQPSDADAPIGPERPGAPLERAPTAVPERSR